MKFIEYVQDQTSLFPPSLNELLKQDDICIIINDIIEKIGVREIENKYVEEGNPAYHPRMMVKLLFYGYARGIRSSRKIAQALEENIKFWYLSGRLTPDFRTISDFRKNHMEEIKTLFKKVVQLCMDMGMVNLGLVAIDGTKIKANASDKQTKSKDDLKKDIDILEKEISSFLDEAEKIDAEEDTVYGRNKRGDEIPHELAQAKSRKERIEKALKKMKKESSEKINMTDNDAKTMKGKRQNYMLAYNCQTAIDSKSDVIIAADSFSNNSDKSLLKDVVESIRKNTGGNPKKLVADCGYYSSNNLIYLESELMNSYIPDARIGKIKQLESGEIKLPEFHKKKFRYDKIRDCYICPENKKLIFYKISKSWTKGHVNRTYKAFAKDCLACKNFGVCTEFYKGRTIEREAMEDLRTRMARKIRTKKGMSIYGKRMHISEMPFGNIKQNLGFREFLLRSRLKADGEFKLISTIHNIKMIQRFIKKKLKIKSPPIDWIDRLIKIAKKPAMATI